jgi:hypothetical protein
MDRKFTIMFNINEFISSNKAVPKINIVILSEAKNLFLSFQVKKSKKEIL